MTDINHRRISNLRIVVALCMCVCVVIVLKIFGADFDHRRRVDDVISFAV